MTGINFNNGNIVGGGGGGDRLWLAAINNNYRRNWQRRRRRRWHDIIWWREGGKNAAMRWMWSNTRIQLKFQSNFDWLPRTIKMGSGLAPNKKTVRCRCFFMNIIKIWPTESGGKRGEGLLSILNWEYKIYIGQIVGRGRVLTVLTVENTQLVVS